MGKRYDSILDTIGNTPVVRINRLGPKHVNLFAKVESFNPMGSIKDRLALGVIEDAERRGELKPGQTIVEATSGNTGIGLAMVCAQKGYPLVVTMAENFSVERRKLMRFLGARVVLTPAAQKGSGMVAKARELARQEGILTGISAGATLAGALQLAASAPDGANILCMLPDTGERYLSTPLFDDVAVEMSAEELALSRSTPNHRFDTAAPPSPSDDTATVDAAARDEVAKLVRSREHPVVMFALEWCEFCWSVRKLLTKYAVPFRSIDLDSVRYQHDDLGGRLRAALRAHTGWSTFPQIFIAGEFIGGCTDLFDRCRDGSLARRLQQHAIPFDASVSIDPYRFLPGWLHPR